MGSGNSERAMICRKVAGKSLASLYEHPNNQPPHDAEHLVFATEK